MKTTIYCLLIALCLRVAFGLIAPRDEPHFGTVGDWLWIEVRGSKATPETTKIFARAKPLFRKNISGEWEIVFVPEKN